MSLSPPLINSSASLGLGERVRVVICALEWQDTPVRGFDGHPLFNKFTAFLEDEMASRRPRPAAGQRFDKHPLGV